MFENVNETRLENGVRVVSISVPHVESVALGMWVGVGSRHESRSMGGASHFLEHLMFKGTKSRSALDISRAIEGRGGYLNAFTQEESTCYYARVGYDHLDESLDVLGDMILNAKLDSDDVGKERNVILEEMMMYQDQPHHLVQEMLEKSIWPRHPLGRPVIGTVKSISEMSTDDLRQFKDTKYVPANTVVAIAGRMEHEHCVARVKDMMARRKQGALPRSKRYSNEPKSEHSSICAKDIEQTHLAMGIRVFGRLDRRRHALKLLNTVLGENMSSRLFQVVREKYGLAYSIHSGCQLYTDSGVLGISAGLDRNRFDKAMGLIFRELDRMRTRPVSVGELKRAKDYVIGQLRLGLESTSNRMMWIGENILIHGRVIDPDESIAALEKVTADQIQKLANTFFTKGRLSVAVVAPTADAPDQARLDQLVDAF